MSDIEVFYYLLEQCKKQETNIKPYQLAETCKLFQPLDFKLFTVRREQ